jgi:hypothetical protein
MRPLCAALTVVAGLAFAAPPASAGKDDIVKIYGVEANFNLYPQKTPQEALQSVTRILEARRIDYLLAFLADPDFVKAKLKVIKAELPKALTDENKDLIAFGRLVKETTKFFVDDPTKAKELFRFLKEGDFQGDDMAATVTLKAIPSRTVFLRKVQDRWHLLDKDR